MKRLILLSLALVATMQSWADVKVPADFRIVGKDGSVAYFRGQGTELTFNTEGTVLNIVTEGQASTISYAVDGIDAIEFDYGGTYADQYSYDGSQIDVAIDPADDTSYTEVAENIITDEADADYGDFIENYMPTNRITITYSGDKATVTGAVTGVASMVNGAHVLITSTKKNIAYTLKGTTTNGSFKLYSDKKTLITMDGVNITNPTGAAINIQTGKTIMVELADGTTNSLVDGTSYTMTTGEDQKGTLFSEGQLIFSGDGSLDVKSNFGHGIVSDDYVRIRSGNIIVNSVRDGINTNDRFIMYGGNVTVTAQEDGLDIGKGYVDIAGGKLTVNAVDEAITASYEGESDGTYDTTIDPYISVRGGLVKVTTTGDKGHGLRALSTLSMTGGVVQATVKGAASKALMSEKAMSLTGGKLTAFTEGNALYEADLKELSSSAVIRSKGTLTIENMTIGAKSTGTGAKGINNVGNVSIKNSKVTVVASGATHQHNSLSSHSRGIDTDATLTLDGGALHVRAYEEPILTATTLTFSNNAVYAGYKLGK